MADAKLEKLQLINVLRGITPVSSVFSTDPTNLTNATDGDFDTATGIGIGTNAAPFGPIGRLTFDMGSTKTVLVGGKFGISVDPANPGDLGIRTRSSADNITFLSAFQNSEFTNSTTETIHEILTKIVNARYIRYEFLLSVVGTGYVRMFEGVAYELVV